MGWSQIRSIMKSFQEKCPNLGRAVILVGAHLSVALFLAPGLGSPREAYSRVVYPFFWESNPPPVQGLEGRMARLVNWDGIHFLSILRNGYTRTDLPGPHSVHEYRDNVSFFPGFPLLASGVQKVTGLSAEMALALTSPLAAVLMWFYFLRLLQRWRGPDSSVSRVSYLIAALLFPTLFYTLVAYSEATFLAAWLGLLLGWDQFRWPASNHPASRWLWLLFAAFHGFFMCLTRSAGLAAAITPLVTEIIYQIFSKRPGRRFEPAMMLASLGVSLVAMAGQAAYFGYLHWLFGDWKWHYVVQKAGYGNELNLAGLWDWRTYFPFPPDARFTPWLSQLMVPLALGLLIWLSIRCLPSALGKARGPVVPAEQRYRGLLGAISAWSLFMIAFLGTLALRNPGMFRYALPVWLAVLLAASSLRQIELTLFGLVPRSRGLRVAAGFVLVLTQLFFIARFTRGYWVS